MIAAGSKKGRQRWTRTDLNLPLSGPNTVLNKTLQIFVPGEATPQDCAPIIAFVQRTGVAMFDQSGVTGSITLTQPSPFDPTISHVVFRNLCLLAGAYHVHKWPVPQRLLRDQDVCGGGSVAGHFNPFGVVYDDRTPAPGQGTEDQYERQRSEVVTFTREKVKVRQPCTFTLADMTCGSFDVVVTARSAVNENYLYRPQYLRVNVTSGTVAGLSWIGELTSEELDKFLENVSNHPPSPQTHNPWRTVSGGDHAAQFAWFDPIRQTAVVSDVTGTLRVEMAGTLSDPRVVIGCRDLRRSEEYPRSLCHSPRGPGEALFARRKESGLRRKRQVVLQDILQNRNITQTKESTDFQNKFKDCTKAELAITSCEPILSSSTLLHAFSGFYAS
ncbi:hypothetical protein ACOMHN_006580 [Nucella lapillus]